MDRVTQAYNEFMTRLFGLVPKDPPAYTVEQDHYTKVMHEVQDKYGLKQGDPDFIEWILTLVGRSPQILMTQTLTTSEGAEENDGREEEKTLGEASPGEPN